MDKDIGSNIMLVNILSILALAGVLWMFVLVQFIARFLRAGDLRRDEAAAEGGPIDDPDDVGMNDTDIL